MRKHDLCVVSVFAFLFSVCWACFAGSAFAAETRTVSLDGVWRVAFDPDNSGKKFEWWKGSLPPTRDIRVPGALQQITEDGTHSGVAWYTRSFETPSPDGPSGRFLLRFWESYYVTEVWLNGKYIGSHEGGEDCFTFDVTRAVRESGGQNSLVVRVVDVGGATPVDSFLSRQIPSCCGTGNGGLIDSVELLVSPAVYLNDLHLLPDWKTGDIAVRVGMVNTLGKEISGRLVLSAKPAGGSNGMKSTAQAEFDVETVPDGVSVAERTIHVPGHRLWELYDPNLYSVTVRWIPKASEGENPRTGEDVRTERCGFRDFRFANGYFRLNGKRIYLKCAHKGAGAMGALRGNNPLDIDLDRQDIILSKAMKFNAIRCLAQMPHRFILDLCDETGLLVYEECHASWGLGYSPRMREYFERSVQGMLLRDRNHPCVIAWGLLNETADPGLVVTAVRFLPTIQKLGPGRMVFLNSGSWDPFVSPVRDDKPFSCWRGGYTTTPFAGINLTGKAIDYEGAVWKPGQFCLQPGSGRARSSAVVRWVPPEAGKFKIDAGFYSIGRPKSHLTVRTLAERFFSFDLNCDGSGSTAAFKGTVALQRNEALYFVVGGGSNDKTGLTLKITSTTGQVWDVVKDFSLEKNPNGPWAYGSIGRPSSEGAKELDCRLLELFVKGESEVRTRSAAVGRVANPGSIEWQNVLADIHPYKSVPHTAEILQALRTCSCDGLPIFLSEYGVGSGRDFFYLARKYEQYGRTGLAYAKGNVSHVDQFLKDWSNWRLSESFVSPEAFLAETIAWMAEGRRYGINAIRSNPNVISHSATMLDDWWGAGEGIVTAYRETKPGTTEVMADLFAPLRFCLFAEPVKLYAGDTVKAEAVLVNEDVLPPGKYPVRFTVTGPENARVCEKIVEIEIPDPGQGKENPFSLPVFSEKIQVNGPPGEYRFRAAFLKGGEAAGGWERFYIDSRDSMPSIRRTCALWTDDSELKDALAKVSLPVVSRKDAERLGLLSKNGDDAPVLLVGGAVGGKKAEEFKRLYETVKRGGKVVFLRPDVFANGISATGFLPFDEKERGILKQRNNWLYHKDDWNKFHPFFAGLPAGRILDHIFWREMIPARGFSGIKVPDEAISGSIYTAFITYESDLTLAVYQWGEGRFVLNTFEIVRNLGKDPSAERLLRNIINGL